mmetsp:Transcript_27530/g.24237  ORF Transcript_27530/g.24237 Transcript_27530/m.24237 type:complete len:97 (-) Transcript_27530:265-555(-)
MVWALYGQTCEATELNEKYFQLFQTYSEAILSCSQLDATDYFCIGFVFGSAPNDNALLSICTCVSDLHDNFKPFLSQDEYISQLIENLNSLELRPQ